MASLVVATPFHAIVCYSEEVSVVILGLTSTFQTVLSVISSNWPSLKIENLSISYAIPDFPKCMLRTDADVRNMVTISQSFGLNRVRISVLVLDIAPFEASSSVDSNSDAFPYLDTEEFIPTFTCPDNTKLLSLGWDKVLTHKGQRFKGGADEYRLALLKNAIFTGYRYFTIKNDRHRITVCCPQKAELGCSWFVHACLDSATQQFFIKEMNDVHTCGISSRTLAGFTNSSKLVTDMVIDDVRIDPSAKPYKVRHNLLESYGVKVSYDIALKGVTDAKSALNGTAKESYHDLRAYADSITATNPGSHVSLEVYEGTNTFRRFFISFSACIEGFNDVRPMLFLDGAHLKSEFKGHILAAVGKDGNQGLYPLCFAFVLSEDVDNWAWFLGHLRQILDPGRKITFITDRHKGLVQGIPLYFPGSFHSFCILHLRFNLRDKCTAKNKGFKYCKERMVVLFNECAYAPTIDLFDAKVKAFVDYGGDVARRFLASIPYENWATAHFKGDRFGEMASSAVESFNNWIKPERSLPMCKSSDAIRIKLMKQMSDRRDAAAGWKTVLCPTIEKYLGKCISDCKRLSIIKSSDDVYEVQSEPTCTVDFSLLSCSCNIWQSTRVPCLHAVACILRFGKKFEAYTDVAYLTKTFAASYSAGLYPISTIYKCSSSTGSSSSDDVLPPLSKRPPGRPQIVRIPNRGDLKRKMICSRCHVHGSHNKRTCNASVQF